MTDQRWPVCPCLTCTIFGSCSQVIGERQGATYLSMKLKDQARSMDILRKDPALSGLERLEAPYLDLEVRGLPALTYFGQQLWGPKLEAWSQGGHRARSVCRVSGSGAPPEGLGRSVGAPCCLPHS